MNTIKLFGKLTIAALTLLFISCSGDDNGGGGSSSGGFVKAKVDGANFSSTSQFVVTVLGEGNLVLQGALANGTSIAINVFAFDGTLETGTYNVGFSNNSEQYTGSLSYNVFSGTTATVYSSLGCDNGTGTVEITAIDADKVEGTFSFDGREIEACSSTKSVTNGTFRGVFAAN